jgi:hypothetical protein
MKIEKEKEKGQAKMLVCWKNNHTNFPYMLFAGRMLVCL